MMMKGKLMKIVSMLLLGVGSFVLLGTVGASDFYEECRAAADCVAGEPMSIGEILVRCAAGIVLICLGILNEVKVKV
jgi:hypothetical protein